MVLVKLFPANTDSAILLCFTKSRTEKDDSCAGFCLQRPYFRNRGIVRLLTAVVTNLTGIVTFIQLSVKSGYHKFGGFSRNGWSCYLEVGPSFNFGDDPHGDRNGFNIMSGTGIRYSF